MLVAHTYKLCHTAVVLNLGSIEFLGLGGGVADVRRRSSETCLKAWLCHSNFTLCYIAQKWFSTKSWKDT